MKKCKHCQSEIDIKATKCPHCQSDLRNWFRRHPIWTGIIGLLVFSYILGSASTTINSPTSEKRFTDLITESKKALNETNQQATVQELPTETPKPKTWETVIELSGNANKRSDIFSLQGGKTKLTYDFKGNIAVIGSIYVLPEGYSLEKQGGFPEVTVSQAGSDSTFLVKDPGNYYLDISSANSTWTVRIEEER